MSALRECIKIVEKEQERGAEYVAFHNGEWRALDAVATVELEQMECEHCGNDTVEKPIEGEWRVTYDEGHLPCFTTDPDDEGCELAWESVPVLLNDQATLIAELNEEIARLRREWPV